MRIGEILIGAKLASAKDVEAGLQRQFKEGGRLGDNLIALGIVDRNTIERLLRISPPRPASIHESGIKEIDLLDLLMKLVFVNGLETTTQIANEIKLPHQLAVQLAEVAASRQLLSVVGAEGSGSLAQVRYEITDAGRHWAAGALSRSQYVGPAPVPLDAFRERVLLQRVANERVRLERIREALSGLYVGDALLHDIGPALNSGRPILLYGPPGNGKTTIAFRLGRIMRDIVYIPYAVMIEGQIMRVFDSKVHSALVMEEPSPAQISQSLRDEEFDGRWVPCQRPFVVAGGELTLEMLELGYDPVSKYYEAPLHVKALGGSILIDDFGRQLVPPVTLLNRWIVPLENRIDFLKLQSGKSFELPFEARVMFSTNLEPEDLMDPAFLRRIPFKLEIAPPTPDRFRSIFAVAARDSGLPFSQDVVDLVVHELTVKRHIELAAYQPAFIAEQVTARCEFEGVEPHLDAPLIEAAINNIAVRRYRPASPKQS